MRTVAVIFLLVISLLAFVAAGYVGLKGNLIGGGIIWIGALVSFALALHLVPNTKGGDASDATTDHEIVR